MSIFRRFQQNAQGTTIIEFAIVAPLFFFILFAIIEFGLIRFSQVAVEAAVTQASRTSAVGTSSAGCDRACSVRALVQRKTSGLISGDTVTISASVVGTGETSPPDICLTEPPGTPPTGQCKQPDGSDGAYQDNNANGRYDGPGNLTLGNAGDVVELRVSYPWRVQIPLMRSLFDDGVYMISSTTLVKNEP